MQLVQQDTLGALDPRAPIGRQIEEPLAIHDVDCTRIERRDRAIALLARIGLSQDMYWRYPHELSGGQRQRVVLARALVLAPRLIVCDEPVSALDVSIQAQILNLMQDLQSERGLTYLFISHDLGVMRLISDDLAVMYLGRIVETGKTSEVLSDPQHPYTKALVAASPKRGLRRRASALIEGDPPSPVDVPPGCALHPRCPIAVERCRRERPALVAVGGDRHVACHLAERQ
jgi:peptide/nickel transport system ATP-binding protein